MIKIKFNIIVVLGIIFVSSCNNNSIENKAIELIKYAENNLYYDSPTNDSILNIVNSYYPNKEEDAHILSLLKNRYINIKHIDSTTLESTAQYFEKKGEYALAATAYLRLGEYIYEHFHENRFVAVRYISKAEFLCHNKQSMLYANIQYANSLLYNNIDNPSIHKLNHLHNALNIYKKYSKHKFIARCYTDIMSSHWSLDSSYYYYKLLKEPIIQNNIDSIFKLNIDFRYAVRFMDVLPPDSLLKLATPLYTADKDLEHSLALAFFYVMKHDTLSAETYIQQISDDKTFKSNYYRLQYIKAIQKKDYARAIIMDKYSDTLLHNAVRRLYSENLSLLSEITKADLTYIQSEIEQKNMQKKLFINIISMLIIIILSLSIYIYMSNQHKKLRKNRDKAIAIIKKQNEQYSTFKNKTTIAIKDDILQLHYSTDNAKNIMEKIDSYTDNMVSLFLNKFPILTKKNAIILVLKYLGCTTNEIATFFGTKPSTVYHRFTYIKKILECNETIETWLNKQAEELISDFNNLYHKTSEQNNQMKINKE